MGAGPRATAELVEGVRSPPLHQLLGKLVAHRMPVRGLKGLRRRCGATDEDLEWLVLTLPRSLGCSPSAAGSLGSYSAVGWRPLSLRV